MTRPFIFSRITKIVVLIALVGIIGCAGDTASDKNNSVDDQALDQNVEELAKFVIDEPFEEAKIEAEELIIADPTQASTLTSQTGATFYIPANCFVDASGAIVTEPVSLKYREFKKVSEVIASGVPMKVAMPDGEVEWMQTAGMFELKGYVGKTAIEIAENKAIDVDFLSDVDGSYDFWIFDEEEGNWINLGESEAPVEQRSTATLPELQKEIKRLQSLTARPPMDPVTEKKDEFWVSDQIDLRAFPELQGKKPLVFTYADTEQRRASRDDQWIRFRNWSWQKLEATEEEGIYKLSLMAEDTTFSVDVQIAPKGEDLEIAKAKYEALKAEYESNLNTLRDQEAFAQTQVAFRRTISVSQFGLYNYDVLWSRVRAIKLLADFDFGAEFNFAKDKIVVYLVTGDNNVVIGLKQREWKNIRIFPDMNNKFIAALPRGKLAYFSQSDFKSEEENLRKAQNEEYVFKMKIEELPIESTEDLEQAINLASL